VVQGRVPGGVAQLVVGLDGRDRRQTQRRAGHPAGDSALHHFSRLLSRAIRGDDVAGRIGGEEFAVWLPGASLERGRQVAERLRQGLAYSDWRWQGEGGG